MKPKQEKKKLLCQQCDTECAATSTQNNDAFLHEMKTINTMRTTTISAFFCYISVYYFPSVVTSCQVQKVFVGFFSSSFFYMKKKKKIVVYFLCSQTDFSLRNLHDWFFVRCFFFLLLFPHLLKRAPGSTAHSH